MQGTAEFPPITVTVRARVRVRGMIGIRLKPQDSKAYILVQKGENLPGN